MSLTREQIEDWQQHFKAQAQSGDITVELWHELRTLCDMALRAERAEAELAALRHERDDPIAAAMGRAAPAAPNYDDTTQHYDTGSTNAAPAAPGKETK